MKIILNGLDKDDLLLGIRAAKWMIEHDECASTIIAYGDKPTTDFYVKRNKASITVRRCS